MIESTGLGIGWSTKDINTVWLKVDQINSYNNINYQFIRLVARSKCKGYSSKIIMTKPHKPLS